MRKMCKVLTIVAIALVSTFSASAGDTYSLCDGKVTVNVKDFAASNNEIRACYTVTVAADAIPECQSLILTPVVKNDNEKHLVEVVVVNGSARKGINKWLACQIQKVCTPDEIRVLNLEKGQSLTFETCKAVPCNDVRADQKFYITTQKVTYNSGICIKNYPGEEYVCDVICEPYEINPVTVGLGLGQTNLNAAPHSVKAQLFYPVNGVAKVASYLKNADALAVLDALDETDYTATSIVISGWASPESSVAYNKSLSVKRANTVKKIVADKYKYDNSIYTVNGNGEYWDAVIDFVNNSDDATIAASRSELKNAIAANDNLDKREAAIKAIAQGKPYKVIFKEVYPVSRFAECVVNYTVKKFNLADAKTIYAVDPNGLTAADYTQWAVEEYDAAVHAKALQLYPNDEGLNAIAGEKAYAKGDYDAAIAFYKKAGSSAQVANNLGCCYLAKGDAAAAEACFAKAGKYGDANAEEIEKVKYNNKYFAK